MESFALYKVRRFEKILASAYDIAVVTHMKPDGDAVGSSTAMYHFLKNSGKSVRIVYPDPWPANLDFLISEDTAADVYDYRKDPEGSAAAIAASDLIICLDFNAFHRTDGLEGLLEGASCDKILIDHHLLPESEKFSLIFSETEVSSTCELLYTILMHTEQIGHNASRLPLEAATSLMTGMTTDTNNFGNSVFPGTLHMASDLLKAGVDRGMILENLYNRFSEDRLRLMGHIMKDLLTITADGVAYIVLDADTLRRYNTQEGDTEGFVNMPLSIETVKMSLLLKEDGEKVRVSIRSKKGISANRCARLHFNGGGHENAAGGRLHMGKEISCMAEVSDYIERHTHIFMTEKDEE
ncbi:MAG: hypothetical protein E7118_05505 [Bacteroidales bacterium]|nr:hypothetical protein [Bacteroidales bacterium]